MKRSAILSALVFGAFLMVAACSQADMQKYLGVATKVQQGATKIAAATTQPGVQLVETFAPQTTPLFNLVGLIASGVAGVASTAVVVLGKKLGTANANADAAVAQATTATVQAETATSAVSELASDIAAYKSPNEDWSANTKKLLLDLGHVAVASI